MTFHLTVIVALFGKITSLDGPVYLEEIGCNEGIQIALDAIENGRLALICGAGLSMADLAVSTNVDRLIETAGMLLKGHVETAIDRDRAAAAAGDTSVLFKLHGCWDVRSRKNARNT